MLNKQFIICFHIVAIIKMTSFQRFKRDMRSRSSSQIKTNHSKQRRQNNIIHDLLKFSSSDIRFTYDEKYPYSYYKLKIMNLTGFSIHYKIRCNNSECYSVNPYEEVIKDKQSIEVKFEFIPKKNDFRSNSSDKFQIMWGKIPYNPNEQSTLTQCKIFHVYIDVKNAQIFDFDSQPKQSKPFFGQQEQGRKTLNYLESNKNIENVQTGVNRPIYSNTNLQDLSINTKSLLTKTNMIIVCVVSFMLGFVLT